jgi:hypothetical protein
MSSQIENWCTQAWSFLGQLPGDVCSELRAEWGARQNIEQLSVVFFGPYDSGKSSLLKRLLVDSGHSIPEGLTISARRETFEICETQIEGLTLRDTPGIAGGNSVHQQVALESLLSSDVIVVILPFQGVTSEKELLLSIMHGKWFGCAPSFAYAPRGCAVVLSRMDEAGVDPRVSPREYMALVDRKAVELRSFLSDAPENLISIHAVCADPGQLIGNAKPEGRHEYDAGREWDGVSQFFDFLKGLRDRKEELRRHSEVRFLGFKMVELLEELQGMAANTESGFREWQHEALAHRLSIERLNALLNSAKADLSRYIEEEIASAARRGATDAKNLKKELTVNLDSAFHRWADNHEAALQKFLSETDSECQRRWGRPSFEKLMKSLSEDSTNADPSNKISKDGGRRAPYSKIMNALHKGFKEIQELRVGMPLEKAAAEVQRLKSAGSFEKYLSQIKGVPLLKDRKHAEVVEKAVKATKFLDIAVPVLLELGPLLLEFIGDERAAKKRRAQREKIRSQITDYAANFEKEAWRQWCDEGVPGAALKSFEEQRQSAEASAETLQLDLKAINRRIEGLESLLLEARDRGGS